MRKISVVDVVFNLALLCSVFAQFFDAGEYARADFGVSAIIAAIIAAAATSVSGGMQNKARREAEKKSLGLANIAREDALSQQATTEKLSKRKLSLYEDKFDYDKMIQREGTNKAHIKLLGDTMSRLSKSDMNMQDFTLSLYGGASPRRAA